MWTLSLFEGDLELGTGSRGRVVLAVTVRQGVVYYEFGTRVCELEYLNPYLVLTLILSEIHLINKSKFTFCYAILALIILILNPVSLRETLILRPYSLALTLAPINHCLFPIFRSRF